MGLRSEGANQGNDNRGSSPETVNLARFYRNEGKSKKVLIKLRSIKTRLCCLIPQTCSSRVRNKRRDDGTSVVVFVNLLVVYIISYSILKSARIRIFWDIWTH